MFLRYYCELGQPFEQTSARLLESPGTWLPGLAARANRRGELLAQVGPEFGRYRLVKRVDVQIAPPLCLPGRVVLPLSWRATGPSALFPAFQGELELGPLGPECTQLVINVNYRPPLGMVGLTVDRLVLHRLAEATIKDFLDRVRDALRMPTGKGRRSPSDRTAAVLAATETPAAGS